MAKKIKSFTVDEGAYVQLIAMFRKYQVDVSLSYYVDQCLRNLAKGLKDVETALENPKYTVPMAYVIERTVKPSILPGESEAQDETEITDEELLELELEDWQARYEAERRRIPRKVYDWIKHGAFELSEDKKYLIQRASGKRYLIIGDKVKEVEDSK